MISSSPSVAAKGMERGGGERGEGEYFSPAAFLSGKEGRKETITVTGSAGRVFFSLLLFF